jgi:uncharacterized protein
LWSTDTSTSANLHFQNWGQKKTYEQLKDLPDSIIAADNIEFNFKNKIPVRQFGVY